MIFEFAMKSKPKMHSYLAPKKKEVVGALGWE
jgi:hypothetical protein